VGDIKQEDCGRGQAVEKMRPYIKITKAKRTMGMTQVVDPLPSEHETLSTQYHRKEKNK
jgi:hypothetical protein